jgi:hypothetical protein
LKDRLFDCGPLLIFLNESFNFLEYMILPKKSLPDTGERA